jgi:ABC-type methionine transport system permease subunit
MKNKYSIIKYILASIFWSVFYCCMAALCFLVERKTTNIVRSNIFMILIFALCVITGFIAGLSCLHDKENRK